MRGGKVTANTDTLTVRFAAERDRLRGVAYRLLGSAAEAEDALQEAWIKAQRADIDDVDNFSGWLTTVVARVCLDMLRSRKARREDALDPGDFVTLSGAEPARNAEDEVMLAESVGTALLVVLNRLAPGERIAFVLHDLFGISFDRIAAILGRSGEATRQLASRARRRLRGGDSGDGADIARQRRIVGAFAAASREGRFDELMTLLDPDVTLTIDRSLLPPGAPAVVIGAETVAQRARIGAMRAAELMLIDGAVGIVSAPLGVPDRLLRFTLAKDRIVAIEVVADQDRLDALKVAMLPMPGDDG